MPTLPATSTYTSCWTTSPPTKRPRSPSGSPTPDTSSSWLNLVEGWFSVLTELGLRRGTFTSLDELIAGIELRAEHWNESPNPFVWTKTADEIIVKVKRGRATLTTVTKSATRGRVTVTSCVLCRSMRAVSRDRVIRVKGNTMRRVSHTLSLPQPHRRAGLR